MILERNKSYKGDCIELMKSLPDESVDVICTDPPYLYLKNQKLDRFFDEKAYFDQVKRVLKKDGFIILFGRGTSFYRWNTILADLAFTFKEEIIWDKLYTSSPVLPVSRIHETISIHTKGNGRINKHKVDYIDAKGYDISKMIDDINRIKTAFNNNEHFEKIEKYLLKKKREDYIDTRFATTHSVTFSSKRLGSQVVNPVQSMVEGMNEKDIIRLRREHYHSIHPTQKPPRLLERLLALVCKIEPNTPKPLVLDTFRGSASTDIACMNFGVDCISFEIDDEYFEKGEERKAEHRKNLQPDLFKVAL